MARRSGSLDILQGPVVAAQPSGYVVKALGSWVKPGELLTRDQVDVAREIFNGFGVEANHLRFEAFAVYDLVEPGHR